MESFARRYSRGSDDYDDLYQVGCIGLIKAIDRFQIERGDEFAAFAVPNIAGEIRRYLRDRAASVRLPRRVLELRGAAVRAHAELTARLGRSPTHAEMARELSADEQDVALALDASRVSQAYELGAEAAGEVEPIDAAEDRMFLSEAFRGLDEADRRILFLRYVRDLEPADIARELGISPRQLSRRTRAALSKLRHELERSGAVDEEDRRPTAAHSSDPLAPPKIAPMSSTEAREKRYLEQPYHLELVRETNTGGGWSARVEELPDCVAHGATPEDALDRLEQAMRGWIADALAHGREVPKPRSPASHSGRLLVRMPQSMHAALADAAEREETSLNQFINSALASAIGWRRQQAASDNSPGDEMRRRALMANIVVLGLVGVIALVLLVIVVAQKL